MNQAFDKTSYAVHENVYDNERSHSLAPAWMTEGTIDAWRHTQMYQCLDPLLGQVGGSRWLTVGDGRCGTDAHYLEQHGMDALASDISDTMLRVAHSHGYIREYKKENAEKLTFADESFDFVLCKEAYHHFPRPMVALYEMIRVARRGVILIEPDDSAILMDGRHLLKMITKAAMLRLGMGRIFGSTDTSIIDNGSNWYEEVGNYGYAISKREIEKVALGLNYPHVAFRGLNDAYIAGGEHESLLGDSPMLRELSREINEMDRHAKRGLSRGRHKLLVAIIFKEEIGGNLRDSLTAGMFDVRDMPRNPYAASLASEPR